MVSTPNSLCRETGRWLNGIEYGQQQEFMYHQVIQKVSYIYDPMLSNKPVLSKTYWELYK